MKQRVLSVTLADCRVDTFRCGGNGGQNVNKRDTGVRIVHEPSGAVGQSCDERSQLQNRKAAFNRMANHPKFKVWLNRELYGLSGDGNRGYAWRFERGRWVSNDAQGLDMRDVRIEVRHLGRWVEGDAA